MPPALRHPATANGVTRRELAGIAMVPLQALRFHPRNIRGNLGDLAELAASIRHEGVLVPLMAERRPGGGLRLLHGHRRWAAADQAGLTRVPVQIVAAHTDDEAILLMLAEDKKQAVDLSDRAKAIRVLHDEFHYSWPAIAERLGITTDELAAWRKDTNPARRTQAPAPPRRPAATPAPAGRITDPAPAGGLTGRERQVVSLAAHGMSNQAIADQLYLGPDTVKSHLRRVFHKLGVNNRAQAVAVAQQRGLLVDTTDLPATARRSPDRRGPAVPRVKPSEVHALATRWDGRAPAPLIAELRALLGTWQPATTVTRKAAS